MRKLVMLILGLLVLLFLPYWSSGYFTDDFGWAFLFGDYGYYTPVLSGAFLFGDFSVTIFLLEVLLLVGLNAAWKKSEASQAGSQAVAAPPPAAASSDAVSELAKLNELRQAGALTEEEFQAQKARLLGGAPAPGPTPAPAAAAAGPANAAVSVGGETFPTRKIANAVAELRKAGVEEKMIAGPANRWAWQSGIALPPGPYVPDEPAYLAGLAAVIGLAFGVLSSLLFTLFVGSVGFGGFLFLAVAFGAGMGAVLVINTRKLKEKHALPAWQTIPG